MAEFDPIIINHIRMQEYVANRRRYRRQRFLDFGRHILDRTEFGNSRASSAISRVRREVMVAFEKAFARSPVSMAAACSASYLSLMVRRRWISANFRAGGFPSNTKTSSIP